MPEYKVVWEIDINATTPLEAAKEALEIMRDDTSISTVFDTFDGVNQTRVDLEDDSYVNI